MGWCAVQLRRHILYRGMASKQLWLINPRSGNGVGQRLLKKVSGCPGVVSVPLDFSRLPEQLERAARFDLLVVAGGDGTAASVLCSTYLPEVPVLPMPLGTANDLARELGIARAVSGIETKALPGLFAGLPAQDFATWELRFEGEAAHFVAMRPLDMRGGSCLSLALGARRAAAELAPAGDAAH